MLCDKDKKGRRRYIDGNVCLRETTDERKRSYEVRKYDHNVDRGPVRQA